jgi:acetyl-CoA carboxylase beta subunit
MKLCTVKPLSIFSEEVVKKNDECRKLIYMDDVQRPEKVNNTCVKTVHAGTMDRGFAVVH